MRSALEIAQAERAVALSDAETWRQIAEERQARIVELEERNASLESDDPSIYDQFISQKRRAETAEKERDALRAILAAMPHEALSYMEPEQVEAVYAAREGKP